MRRYAVPDDFLGPYMNCWCLAEWTSPEELGTREEIEALGIPFPERGVYIPLVCYRDGGEPNMLDSEQLNLNVLEKFISVCLKHKHDSLTHRYHFMKNEYDRIEAEKKQHLIDMIEDGAPAYIDAASFNGQTNVNSVVKQKLEYLEKNYSQIANVAKRFPSRRGTVQV